MKALRILLLLHSENIPPQNVDELSEQEFNPYKSEHDVRESLDELGHKVHQLGLGDELTPIRHAIEKHNPHLVFNLLTHFHQVGILDAHIVSYLELLKVPYTGCNPRGLLLASHKPLAKKILTYHRIPVPHFVTFPRDRVVRAPRRLSFPLFVKSAYEHSSLGIAQTSIVHDEKSLRERVEFVHSYVGTDAMVEEYVEGRELSIGVLGNRRLVTLPVWETLFRNLPAGAAPIQTSRMKFDLAYQKKVGLTSAPAKDLAPALVTKIEKMARRVYRLLEMSGFARIDLRMNAEGRVFVLEANPNPDLSFREDFAEAAEAAGLSYSQLIQRLCNLGIRYMPNWKRA